MCKTIYPPIHPGRYNRLQPATAYLAAHLPSEARCSMRRTANSAHMVFPLPVGAQTSALSSVLYRQLYTWVWMGLKCLRPLGGRGGRGSREGELARGETVTVFTI